MPYTLKYDKGEFVARFSGFVTAEELNAANGEIQGHAYFDFHNLQVVDLLEADLSSVTEEDTEFPAQTDGIASTTRWGVKVAIVVQERHALNIVNEYVENSRRYAPRWDYRVFSTLEAASNWGRA